MNFATFRQLNNGNIIRFLIVFNCFSLFEKSYEQLVASKQIDKWDYTIKTKLHELNIWWAARKITTNVSFIEDQIKLKELISLIEYL